MVSDAVVGTQMEKPSRSSNFEILRILCILMIVMHHLIRYSNLTHPVVDLQHTVFLGFLDSFGKVGAMAFIMISGYFMIKKEISLKKIALLIAELWFYVYAINILLLITGDLELNWGVVVHTLFPMIMCEYWFVTYYTILMALSPAINKLLNSVTQKQYLVLLGFLALISFVIPTVLSKYQFSELLLMTFGYAFAAYVRLYPSSIFDNQKVNAGTLCFTLILCIFIVALQYELFVAGDFEQLVFDENPLFLAIILFAILSVLLILRFCSENRLKVLGIWLLALIVLGNVANVLYNNHDGVDQLNNSWNGFVIITSVALFLIFKNINIGSVRPVNIMAGSVLATYLITDEMYFRDILWGAVDLPGHMATDWFYLYTIGIVLLLFVVCTVIDLGRRAIFRYFSKFGQCLLARIEAVCGSVDSTMEQLISKNKYEK